MKELQPMKKLTAIIFVTVLILAATLAPMSGAALAVTLTRTRTRTPTPVTATPECHVVTFSDGTVIKANRRLSWQAAIL